MKKILMAGFCAMALTTSANAASDGTPQALACMKKYGFTPEQWHAYAVPAEKAEPYRLCRDSGGRPDAANIKTKCLTQAGVTPQQWSAKQATLAQGAAVKSCMAQHGINMTVTRRDGSTF